MAYFAEGTEAMIALEAMIDKVGLRNVMYAAASICAAKAQHIDDSYRASSKAPKELLVKAWEADARTVERAAKTICTDA